MQENISGCFFWTQCIDTAKSDKRMQYTQKRPCTLQNHTWTTAVVFHMVNGWLEFNGTFSTNYHFWWIKIFKKAISCPAEIKVCLKSFISFKKLKIYCLGALIKMWESWTWLMQHWIKLLLKMWES